MHAPRSKPKDNFPFCLLRASALQNMSCSSDIFESGYCISSQMLLDDVGIFPILYIYVVSS